MENSKGIADRSQPRLRLASVLIIVSLLILVVPALVHSTPSGQTWSVEGGGFCSGDFTVYNATTASTPQNTVFVQNCATGINVASTLTDVGGLVTTLLAGSTNCPNGCEVDFRTGVYAMTTPIIIGRNSVHLKGTVSGGDAAYYAQNQQPDGRLNGTFLVAKASMTNMIEGTTNPVYTSSLAWSHINIENLQLWANCKATNGINLASFEASTYNIIRNVMFGLRINLGNPGGTCGFTGIGVIMDGNEDSVVEDSQWAGALDTGRGGAAVDLQWQVAGGNGIMLNDLFGGAISIQISGQQFAVTDGTINDVKLLGNIFMLAITNSYFANWVSGQTPTSRINLNGFTIEDLNFLGDFLYLTGVGTPSMSMFGGTGTVFNQGWSGDNLQSVSSPSWNPGGATLDKQVTDGDNHNHNLVNCVAGACFTGFPFTIDTNGNF